MLLTLLILLIRAAPTLHLEALLLLGALHCLNRLDGWCTALPGTEVADLLAQLHNNLVLTSERILRSLGIADGFF